MYEVGRGLTQDQVEALRWIRKAADAGESSAEYMLGLVYREGNGATQDYAEAVRWFRKAADAGNAKAQFNLGLMYEEGQGVTQDYAEAVRWYRNAADAENTDARSNLGLMYDKGRGVTQDYAEAIRWFRKAADAGNAAQFNLGYICTGKVKACHGTTYWRIYGSTFLLQAPVARTRNDGPKREMTLRINYPLNNWDRLNGSPGNGGQRRNNTSLPPASEPMVECYGAGASRAIPPRQAGAFRDAQIQGGREAIPGEIESRWTMGYPDGTVSSLEWGWEPGYTSSWYPGSRTAADTSFEKRCRNRSRGEDSP